MFLVSTGCGKSPASLSMTGDPGRIFLGNSVYVVIFFNRSDWVLLNFKHASELTVLLRKRNAKFITNVPLYLGRFR